MTDLAPYIKQLLFLNDCVIIPSFGGIMAQYASAQVHPIQNIFTPPHKTLAFNKSLIHNDGLLVSEIVRFTNVSYDAATITIHQYVRKLENDLSGKGQAIITGVGKFYFDIEQNLLFESSEEINYLTNAFGFDRFVAKPVMRHEQVVHQLANTPVKKKSRSRFGWAGFGVMLALIVIGLQIINISNDFKIFHLDKSNFWNSITSIFKSDSSLMKTNDLKPYNSNVNNEITSHRKDTLVQIIVYQQPVSTTPTSTNAIAKIQTKEIDPESLTEDANPDKTDTDISSQNNIAMNASVASAISYALTTIQKNQSKYFVVFACLKSQSRTDLFIQQMKKKGIDVTVLMQDSYFRVGKGGFNSSEEAVDSMRTYRAQGIADVWVMKK